MFTNDGTIPYGSKILTIGGAAFVADDIQVSRPSKKISRTNQLDEPTGSVNYEDFHTFTCTLQYETDATPPPAKGAECLQTFDAVYGAETWFLFDLTQPFQKDQETKVQATFHKKYNL
jgi:hypothetical protein